MKKLFVVIITLFLSFIVVGCSSEQLVLWNLTSEKGEEIKVKVQQIRTPFNKGISIYIDGDEVIKGNGGKDKKNEYNADYKGKTVKAFMIYDSETGDETLELTIDGKIVGEFTFPKRN